MLVLQLVALSLDCSGSHIHMMMTVLAYWYSPQHNTHTNTTMQKYVLAKTIININASLCKY